MSTVSSHQCHCLSKQIGLSQFQTESTTLVDARQCAASNYIVQPDKLQYGFQTLNFKQKSDEDLHLRSQYCGSIDSGGVFKCGTGDGSLASVYGFSDLEYESRSFVPKDDMILTVFSEVVNETTLSRTVEVQQEIPVIVSYPFCKAPCFLSSIDKAICNCSNYPIWFMIDFGDGSEYQSYMTEFQKNGIKFAHYYNSTGTYQLTFQARNSSHLLQKIELFFQVDERVEIKSLTANVSLFETEAEIGVSFYYGQNFDCAVTYGDGTPSEKHTSLNMRSFNALRRTYRDPGVYDVNLTCSHFTITRSIGFTMTVQEALAGLVAENEAQISFDDVYEHRWYLIRGSDAKCKVFFGSTSLIERSSSPEASDVNSFFFDRETNQGIALIAMPDEEQFGLFTVVVICYNGLSNSPLVAISYLSVDVPIESVRLNRFKEKEFYQVDEDIPLLLNVVGGSNFVMHWYTVNENEDLEGIVELCKEACLSR